MTLIMGRITLISKIQMQNKIRIIYILLTLLLFVVGMVFSDVIFEMIVLVIIQLISGLIVVRKYKTSSNNRWIFVFIVFILFLLSYAAYEKNKEHYGVIGPDDYRYKNLQELYRKNEKVEP